MQFTDREREIVLSSLRITAKQSPWMAEEIDPLMLKIKEDRPPLVITSGGLVQNAEQNDNVDVLDYDNFSWDMDDDEVKESWMALADQAQQYIRDNSQEIIDRLEKIQPGITAK